MLIERKHMRDVLVWADDNDAAKSRSTPRRSKMSPAVGSGQNTATSAAAGAAPRLLNGTRAVRRRSGDGCPSECETAPRCARRDPGFARSAAGCAPATGQAQLRAPRAHWRAGDAGSAWCERAEDGCDHEAGAAPDQRGENDVGISTRSGGSEILTFPSVRTCAWSCVPACSDTRRNPSRRTSGNSGVYRCAPVLGTGSLCVTSQHVTHREELVSVRGSEPRITPLRRPGRRPFACGAFQ